MTSLLSLSVPNTQFLWGMGVLFVFPATAALMMLALYRLFTS